MPYIAPVVASSFLALAAVTPPAEMHPIDLRAIFCRDYNDVSVLRHLSQLSYPGDERPRPRLLGEARIEGHALDSCEVRFFYDLRFVDASLPLKISGKKVQMQIYADIDTRERYYTWVVEFRPRK